MHVILDNCASHKHPKVRAWLARHSRWTFHFTPTSASWLNAVEGFFARLTRRRLQRGVFHSPVDLHAAINRFLTDHNQSPKPFVWAADPTNLSTKRQWIAELARKHPEQVLSSLHHLIDREWMFEAYRLTRKDGAPGIDGMMAAD